MACRIPPYLVPGATIAVVATARKIIAEELQPALDVLKAWGFKVEVGKNIFKEHFQFAGTDGERLADLQTALDNPSVDAILFARGGYGTVRIIDHLNFDAFIKSPKWLIGYSDITVLHCHLNRLRVASIHASMPINFPKNSMLALQSLRDSLMGEAPLYQLPGLPGRAGRAKGELVGGNLSILYSLAGSDSQLDTRGKILFMEDLDEHLYHLDRMMMGLKRSGMFEGLAGLVVGSMAAMRDHLKIYGFASDNPFGMQAQDIIASHMAEYDFPYVFDFPAGHLSDNRSLIMGATYEMELNASGFFLQPAF